MAQNKRKRKHRGNAAGMVEARGRTGRSSAQASRQAPKTAAERRRERFERPPSWRTAVTRSGITAVFLLVVMLLILKRSIAQTLPLVVFMFLMYIPLGYGLDAMLFRWRQNRGKR